MHLAGTSSGGASSTFLLVLLIVSLQWELLESRFSWLVSTSASVSSRASLRRATKDDDFGGDDIAGFDQFGAIPILKTARRCVTRASPIIALRFTYNTGNINATSTSTSTANTNTNASATESTIPRGNGTLLAWGYDISSPFEMRMHVQSYHTLGHPFQRCILTGLAGDCRIVARFVKQTALNHTMEFDCPASGRYLSQKLAEFMQVYTMGGGNRPMICHAFICSGLRSESSLYSIDPGGEVVKVNAGCAGRFSALGKELIEKEYRSNETTLEGAMAIARRIINPPSLLAKDETLLSEGGAEGEGEGEEERGKGKEGGAKELAVEFCVIFDDEDE